MVSNVPVDMVTCCGLVLAWSDGYLTHADSQMILQALVLWHTKTYQVVVQVYFFGLSVTVHIPIIHLLCAHLTSK